MFTPGRRHTISTQINYLNTISQASSGTTTQGSVARSAALYRLAFALRKRFQPPWELDALDDAITFDEEVLNLRPQGHPDRAMALSNLAADLWRRFMRSSNRRDVDQSIKYDLEALTLWPKGHPDRPLSLTNIAASFWIRFPRTGEQSDIDQCIKYCEELLDLCPEGHPLGAMTLNNLASALHKRFLCSGDRNDLERSITFNREMLRLWPEEHPVRAISSNNLAACPMVQLTHAGCRRRIGSDVTHSDQSNLCPEGQRVRVMALGNLALCLGDRFEITGDQVDLEQSIKYNYEALNHRPEGHPDRALSLNNLAIALELRSLQARDPSDLDHSVKYGQEALMLRAKGHPARASSLNVLAASLKFRFEQTGERRDLEDAITYDQEASNIIPDGHEEKSIAFGNLAWGLWLRFKQDADVQDLEHSIKYYEKGLHLRPQGHCFRHWSLADLARSLRKRFELTRDRKDLEQSITYGQEASNLRPDGHPFRSESLTCLAIGLRLRYTETQDRNDLAACLHLAQQSTAHTSSPVLHRLKASLLLVHTCRRLRDTSSLLDAYETSISLLDQHVGLARGISTRHSRLADSCLTADSQLAHDCYSVQPTDAQQINLADDDCVGGDSTQGLASDAASYALEQSLPETAIELLERGRSILYTQLAQYRPSLADLEEVDQELADHFRALSTKLESFAISPDQRMCLTKTNEDAVAGYQRTIAEWDVAVERIRKLKGFSSFLKVKPYKELQVAARDGPVIIVNISRYRSDAIIVQHTEPPLVIPLPDASIKNVRSLSLSIDLHKMRSGQAIGRRESHRDIASILREIWRMIVGPVAMELEGTLGLARGSRIWWMPTSWTCSLPLHAAGLYVKGSRNMPERFISSYTPTLSMLVRSAARSESSSLAPAQKATPRSLLVTQAIAEGQSRLPGVLEETKTIETIFPQTMTLDGQTCTRAAVLHGLKEAEWVHFACHGHQDTTDPFRSRFSLYKKDEPLTLLDIINHGLPKAELAVLSACHSAEGDKRTPDESVHMAAGMQFSGFKSVVGTLWASADKDGPVIAKAFYQHMFRNGVDGVDFRDLAQALYEAAKELRRRKVPFERWISFVHYGA